MKSITIKSRLGEIQGESDGRIAYFDCYDPKAQKDIRHFVFLEESIKLMYEPWGWKDKWYADLIKIEWISKNEINLKDLYLDIVIENKGTTYRMIDFDDLANALVQGLTNINELEIPLKNLQVFLDNHLHGGKDFPPSIIKSYMEI